jgi:hypothetical protein
VLTGPEAHHTFRDGQVFYAPGNEDTEYYPSGDDHPSEEGSRKATGEFVPLLNVFYHRWAESAASGPVEGQPGATEAPVSEVAAPTTAAPAGGTAVIDDFDGATPAGSSGWVAYYDEATQSTLTCAPQTGAGLDGSAALRLDFDIAAGGWGTCTLFYDQPQDWSAAQGLLFYLLAGQAGLVFDIDLYTGGPDARQTYAFTFETPPESAAGWIPVQLLWQDFLRVAWEENGGAPFADPQHVTGVGFGFSSYEGATNAGNLQIDALGLQSGGGEPPATQAAEAPPEQPAAPTAAAAAPEATAVPPADDGGRSGPACLGGLLPLALGCVLWVWRRNVR